MKEIICVVCPKGCRVQVRGQAGRVDEISGHQCARGEKYARSEFLDPRRILTSSVRLSGPGRNLLPVRSSEPLPRDRLLDCMAEIKKRRVDRPVAMHQVIIENILGTGVNMIACLPLEKEA